MNETIKHAKLDGINPVCVAREVKIVNFAPNDAEKVHMCKPGGRDSRGAVFSGGIGSLKSHIGSAKFTKAFLKSST